MRPEILMDERHRYTVSPPGEVFPSVTTIIKATVPTDFGIAAWYGMKVGCEGAAWLLNRDMLSNSYTGGHLVDLLKKHKLTTNHHRDKAGDRGTLIHAALEEYGETGELKIPEGLDPVEHARIERLAGWLLANRPVFLAQEVMTASLRHKYAGTFDARVRFEAGENKGKVALIDLKTSKGVYPESHFPQLEAYEGAEVELGEDPTDFRAVLHLPAEGEAVLVKSVDSFADFRVLLAQYKSQQARKARMRKGKKDAKAAA